MGTINTKVNTDNVSKHTQSEWRFEDDMNHSIYVEKKSGGKDYITGYTSGKANAAIIVKAVNNFEVMKNFIEKMATKYEGNKFIADEANEILNNIK